MQYLGLAAQLCAFTLVCCYSLPSWADDEPPANTVDFSQAFVVQTPTAPTDTLNIGGVQVHTGERTFRYGLALDFDAETVVVQNAFTLRRVTEQDDNVEALQQALKGTTWTGEYRTSQNLYASTFTIESVQNGFVGGEMLHYSTDPEQATLLRVKLMGEVTTEFLIDEAADGENEWVSSDYYQGLVDAANEANAEIENPAEHKVPSEIFATRQNLRLQRGRGLEFRHATSNWGRYNEYRMVVEGNRMDGAVGAPPNKYSGGSDGLSGNSIIELVLEGTVAEVLE